MTDVFDFCLAVFVEIYKAPKMKLLIFGSSQINFCPFSSKSAYYTLENTGIGWRTKKPLNPMVFKILT